jgi:hypothetical protein
MRAPATAVTGVPVGEGFAQLRHPVPRHRVTHPLTNGAAVICPRPSCARALRWCWTCGCRWRAAEIGVSRVAVSGNCDRLVMTASDQMLFTCSNLLQQLRVWGRVVNSAMGE